MTEITQEQKLVIRASNRERKRRQRQREQETRIRAIQAQKLAIERGERALRQLHFFGECRPGRNSTNFADELQIHREFLRALHQTDVQPNETLRAVAERTYQAWIVGPFVCRGSDGTRYLPGFNRAAQCFDPHYGYVIGDTPFDEIWRAPRDCSGNEAIDVESLPKLPRLPKVEVKVEAKEKEPTAPPPPSLPAIPQQQRNAVHFGWVPPTAHGYLTGR